EETPAPRSKTAAEPVEAAAGEAMRDIVKELKFLRQMMEGQLAGFAWSDLQKHSPEKLEIFRRLLAFGYSPALTRQLLEHMPNNFDVETGMKWIRSALHRNLPVIPAGQDLIERGGVVALVGPTGVGKTTTVAKIAARCTLKHGASKVALITTDSYRIGAHDQLRIYGKILGVPVYSVKDEEDLQLTLSDLGNRFLILIDTVGMSQRDKRLAEQIALLAGNGREVERVLLISATAQGTTLDDVVRCYQQGGGLSGGILTKLDEAMSLGTSLDVIIRHKLPLHYVTNGQRVPEDLHHPNPLYLLDRSFKNEPDASPYTLRAEEYPLFFGANSDQARVSKAGGING
ncbi:MAG: flagellar biosynthesis protein FlhF, partial [Burkholderiales bacterium]